MLERWCMFIEAQYLKWFGFNGAKWYLLIAAQRRWVSTVRQGSISCYVRELHRRVRHQLHAQNQERSNRRGIYPRCVKPLVVELVASLPSFQSASWTISPTTSMSRAVPQPFSVTSCEKQKTTVSDSTEVLLSHCFALPCFLLTCHSRSPAPLNALLSAIPNHAHDDARNSALHISHATYYPSTPIPIQRRTVQSSPATFRSGDPDPCPSLPGTLACPVWIHIYRLRRFRT